MIADKLADALRLMLNSPGSDAARIVALCAMREYRAACDKPFMVPALDLSAAMLRHRERYTAEEQRYLDRIRGNLSKIASM